MSKNIKNNVIAPLATAIWLVDNTSLTFQQIGEFCGFDQSEMKFIADGIIGKGIMPADPTKNGNLTKEEISAREKDGKPLSNAFTSLNGVDIKIQKKKKYIPMIQRQNRPETILWLLGYAPELTDPQIVKLVRTTKSMVEAIRTKTYKGYSELIAKDPVILGFCTQKELNKAVEIAKGNVSKDISKEVKKATPKASSKKTKAKKNKKKKK